MNPETPSTGFTRTTHILVIALLLALASLSVAAVPGRMSAPTYAALSVLLIMIVAVGLNTWRNSQATGSVAQILHEVNDAQPPRTHPRAGR